MSSANDILISWVFLFFFLGGGGLGAVKHVGVGVAVFVGVILAVNGGAVEDRNNYE